MIYQQYREAMVRPACTANSREEVVAQRERERERERESSQVSRKRFSLSVEAALLRAAGVLDELVQGQDVAGGVRAVGPGEPVACDQNRRRKSVNHVRGDKEGQRRGRKGKGGRAEAGKVWAEGSEPRRETACTKHCMLGSSR